MRKKLVLGMVIICVLIAVSGCSGKQGDVSPKSDGSVSNSVTNKNSYGYLKTDEDKQQFLAFWDSINSYYAGIVRAMEQTNNTQKYTFDPSIESEVPTEIKEAYNFNKIFLFPGFDERKNIKINIDGINVEIEFDGEKQFPTDKNYDDIKKIRQRKRPH